MDRRTFIKSLSASSMASPFISQLPQAAVEAAKSTERKSWLFWDKWWFDQFYNLEIAVGQPQWLEECTYVDDIDGLAAWPTVFFDKETDRWRMLYTARWRPYQMMLAESEDGLHFQPKARPDIEPVGGKRAPHHIFTLPDGSCGGIYQDPHAEDGYPFKIYGEQSGEAVLKRARQDPNHRWHGATENKHYIRQGVTLVSKDGIKWEVRPDLAWDQPGWQPEPPIFGFYNPYTKRHCMTVRPGWGDRRVCLQHTDNFKTWSGPELILQPDPLDPDLCEHYGMPVYYYEGCFVGLLWIFHAESSTHTPGFNHFIGPLDCQIAYSYDGIHFFRSLRKPLIPLNPLGQHGCGGLEPSCMVTTDDEIRIYVASSKTHHGRNFQARQAGKKDFESILVYRLRKDGFTMVKPKGSWGTFISKPMALFNSALTINAKAPFGEIHYQLSDIRSNPLPGHTFEDCDPLTGDSLKHQLTWQGKPATIPEDSIVRLEIKMRAAELYAVHGNFHFIDAQDMHLLQDGKSIPPSIKNNL